MKKLSLAIYWHFHQPFYKLDSTYLMPWARLHAVKDYLDMILFLEKFPKLKLNLDVVPALLDTIIDYTNGAQDIHSELSCADVETLNNEEKSFIINNFFSLKIDTMLYRSQTYKNLYAKRLRQECLTPDLYTSQELSDLMALFNLAWIDPMHYETYPQLQALWEKQKGYTKEDRIEILNIHYQIMKSIIPTYKKYIDAGRLELTCSPYYHPILPVLCDSKAAMNIANKTKVGVSNLKMHKDAILQIRAGLNRIEEIFGVRPKSVWIPELCMDSKTIEILSKEGMKWCLSDERILSSSLNCEFVRDFRGNLENPYHLLKVYEYKTKKNPMNIIFRDRSIPNLINFEYGSMDTKMAVNDLYDKIKVIQNRLLTSPDDEHMLTIALDGENCWEDYQNDGYDFLNSLYSTLENDSTLETVLISDYVQNDRNKKTLNKIHAGSWIDDTFKYWIGEPTKNKAWQYLKNAKETYEKIASKQKQKVNIVKAHRELMIAEGSDWFWWYGEPNNSGQDYVFDYMFRERLKNVYKLLNVEIPDYLNEALIEKVDIPFRYPIQNISPRMDGYISSDSDWQNSGNISLLDGPVFRENKSVDKIQFGCDENNIYFRLHVNKGSGEIGFINRINQFFIYLRNTVSIRNRAFVRLIGKTDNQYNIFQEKFENELTLTLVKDSLYPPRLSTCLHNNMWTLSNTDGVNITYKDVIDVTVPFDLIGVRHGETVEFFLANTDSGVKNTYTPQDVLLTMKRN